MTTGAADGESRRPTEDEMLLGVAATFAQRSTCSRGKTGAIVALRGRVLSSGYNGAPAGMPHCDHSCDCVLDIGERKLVRERGHSPHCRSMRPCMTAVHAETNAVAFAARHGVALEGGTMYCVLLPCRSCAQLIINAGIRRVVAIRDEGSITGSSVGTGRTLLEEADVEVEVTR